VADEGLGSTIRTVTVRTVVKFNEDEDGLQPWRSCGFKAALTKGIHLNRLLVTIGSFFVRAVQQNMIL
jgi:hypothetical protein